MSQIQEPEDSIQERETPVSGLPQGSIELPIETPRVAKDGKGPFLILTNDGIKFAKRWFRSRKRVPPKISRLYQLILKIVMMKGVITLIGAQRIGYAEKVIQDAISRRYLRLARKPSKPSREVTQDINKLIGKGRKQLYM